MKKQFIKTKPVVKVTFNPSAELTQDAKEVVLLGDFNNWSLEEGFSLKKQKDGSFKAVVELENEKEFQFKYLVDGSLWINDTQADSFVPGPFGDANSIVSTKA